MQLDSPLIPPLLEAAMACYVSPRPFVVADHRVASSTYDMHQQKAAGGADVFSIHLPTKHSPRQQWRGMNLRLKKLVIFLIN